MHYNFTRITVMWGLMIMFGVIYYQLKTPDEGGVQSMVSVIFITTLFIAIVNMNTSLPVLIRERAVFYRERFSFMYGPEVHALSFALIEILWVLFECLLIVPCLYFMVRSMSRALGPAARTATVPDQAPGPPGWHEPCSGRLLFLSAARLDDDLSLHQPGPVWGCLFPHC